ncbi:MAG: polymerase subunit sigma [Actinomycetia bacterium]|jgi:RNA polymerase sigma-70 factor (ECF subfamily)|nr:polymerase subunit sigma [Actinomycetes bacterium]
MGERGRVDEPDPAIVLAAKAGDLAAFEVLVRSYQAPVWRFLRHLVADAGLAEDVTQETFVRVHRALPRFDGRSRFTTWLFQVARNAGIDALRARDRRDRLPSLAASPPSSPEERHELRAALAALTPDLREALLAVEVLGLTYLEAARMIGVPEGTVKSRVHRARERLVGWLQAGEVTGEV